MTLPITVPAMEQICTIGLCPVEHLDLIERFMPGPVTIIIRARPDLPVGLARNGTIAVRVPDHPLYGPLCARTGPLVMTSANIHGAEPVRDVKEAMEQFGDLIGLMVRDGSMVDSMPSTIIDLTGQEARVIREGRVKSEELFGWSDGRQRAQELGGLWRDRLEGQGPGGQGGGGERHLS
jgi:tRNA threonylcarbamoyl adenosine modification protein (Sua5/YciO/YrdC/YwlC family)